MWPGVLLAGVWPGVLVAGVWPGVLLAGVWPGLLLAYVWPGVLRVGVWRGEFFWQMCGVVSVTVICVVTSVWCSGCMTWHL